MLKGSLGFPVELMHNQCFNYAPECFYDCFLLSLTGNSRSGPGTSDGTGDDENGEVKDD